MSISLSSSALDLSAIRSEFPALAQDFVFLDNAGGSQVLTRVADRVRDYLLTSSVQLGASYAHSQAAGAKVLQARQSVARLINAAHDEEVVMGGATTALMFQLIQAILPQVRPGDEVILTNTDHEANIGAWLRLQAAGATVHFWNVNPQTLELDLADLDKLLSPRTTWVAMTHASNALGTGNPVASGNIQLNGQDRFTVRDGNYFNYVQPWQCHTNTPPDGINLYSFAINPEEHQPSGSCNFSRIDFSQLNISLSNEATGYLGDSSVIYIYATNYNILRIMGGMGGTAYSN